MTTATSPKALVGHGPIPVGDFKTMTTAARGLLDKIGESALADSCTEDLALLTRRHLAPQIDMGNHMKDHSDHPKRPHWADFMSHVTWEQVQDPVSRSTAAQVTGALWAAARAAGAGKDTRGKTRLLPGVFDTTWLRWLPLPRIGAHPMDHTVTLAHADGFDRYATPEELDASYLGRPRTYIFENVHAWYPWVSLVSTWLGAVSESTETVLASIYDSRAADDHLDAHGDAWCGLAVQLAGAKVWNIGPGAGGDLADTQEFTTRAGDVLVIPDMEMHAVSTPAHPGHSRHLVFTVRRYDLPPLV